MELAKSLPRVKNYNVAVAEEGGKVVFLRRVIPGGADKSYGIHVAQLAGLPRSVIHRAEEVLSTLESNRQRNGSRQDHAAPHQQLPLLPQPSPIIDEISKIDIDSMTPLEALNKLYELKQKAKQE